MSRAEVSLQKKKLKTLFLLAWAAKFPRKDTTPILIMTLLITAFLIMTILITFNTGDIAYNDITFD